MNRLLDRETLQELLRDHQAPCLSLYQKTHRSFPQRQQDPLRFRQLVDRLQLSLEQQGWQADAAELIAPLRRLEKDSEFWNHNLDALALFASRDYFEVFRLQRGVPELAIAGERMHITPLLRIAQSADRFQILCLTRDSVRLFEGNRDAIDEIELHAQVPRTLADALGQELTDKGQSGFPQGYGRASERGSSMQLEAGGAGKQAEIDHDRDRYFREVDKAILEHHSRPSGLPLILAALPEQQPHFRNLSRNDQLLAEGIEIGQSGIDAGTLLDHAWKVLQPRYLARLEGLLQRFGSAHGKGLASDEPGEIADAAQAGRVATLLVEAESQMASEDEPQTQHSQLIDELSVSTIQQGGEVIVVPRERMPSTSGAAAIYRF